MQHITTNNFISIIDSIVSKSSRFLKRDFIEIQYMQQNSSSLFNFSLKTLGKFKERLIEGLRDAFPKYSIRLENANQISNLVKAETEDGIITININSGFEYFVKGLNNYFCYITLSDVNSKLKIVAFVNPITDEILFCDESKVYYQLYYKDGSLNHYKIRPSNQNSIYKAHLASDNYKSLKELAKISELVYMSTSISSNSFLISRFILGSVDILILKTQEQKAIEILDFMYEGSSIKKIIYKDFAIYTTTPIYSTINEILNQ
jgi:hypothetical protein